MMRRKTGDRIDMTIGINMNILKFLSSNRKN